jgi:adenylosuccinate lyase
MPHKRNPIGSENLTGISRLLRGYASAGLENVALWHERDISHSSVERVVLPDATTVLHYALGRMRSIIENLVVDTQRMQTNLDATRGLVNSQAVLLALIESGLTRADSYRIVQRNAMAAWDGGGTLLERLQADPEVILDALTLADCFTPERSLRHTGVIFDRLSSAVLQRRT